MYKKFFSFFLIITYIIVADNTTTFHHYLWANYNHFAGKKEHAHHWYTKLFSSTKSPYTYKGYLNFLYDTQQFNAITTLMPSLMKKFEKDPEIQLIFVNALEKTNQIQKADNLIITLSQQFKTHAEITLHAAQVYIRRKELENALVTISSFLNNTPRRPNNFVFYFLKTQIYLQLNKFNEALQDIHLCLELHPHFDKGWLLYASLSEKEGKIKDALTGYAAFLELAPANPAVEKHLCDLTLKYNNMQHNPPLLLSKKITIENALTLFNQQRYSQALEHINSCIDSTPHDIPCKLLKLQILSTMKDFTQITSTITQWIMQEPTHDIWPQTLYLLAHNCAPRLEIMKILQTLTQQIPDNLLCHLYYADLCIREHQTDQALHALNNALLCSADTHQHIAIRYQLALLHHQGKNYDAQLANLEKAYTLNEHCPHINNALAYYWATKGKNRSKAHAFIEKALASDNTNPYFLDTKALILYKEGQYKEAQNILERLAHHNNEIMLLHLTKVQKALNKMELLLNYNTIH